MKNRQIELTKRDIESTDTNELRNRLINELIEIHNVPASEAVKSVEEILEGLKPRK